SVDGINKRSRAIELLEDLCEGPEGGTEDPRLVLALAKLLFRDDQKGRAMGLCARIFELFTAQCSADGTSPIAGEVHIADVCDAYYLGGWISIHDDNHTVAYRVWRQGYAAAAGVELLRVQCSKRVVWDKAWGQCCEEGAPSRVAHLVGSAGPHPSGGINQYSIEDLECFRAVDPPCCPALALFPEEQEARGVVFRTRDPVLTVEECSRVLRLVYEHHAQNCGNVWSTVRQSSVKTTDVAVEDIVVLRDWLLVLMHTRLYPLIDTAFPKLIDVGSSTMLPGGAGSRIRIHDAFIVRYDAEKDMSLSLPEHCDTSAVSIVVSLNQEDGYAQEGATGDYQGGGTWFEAIGKAKKGCVANSQIGGAVLFAGPLKHAGFPICRGVRHILVLFLYVEGFHYGPYLSVAKENAANLAATNARQTEHNESGLVHSCEDIDITSDDTSALPSGGEKGGFVVYKQTVDLVTMLEKSAVKGGDEQ
ncbi:unnamed protein product, partial [Ectocarpus fasciculatus]